MSGRQGAGVTMVIDAAMTTGVPDEFDRKTAAIGIGDPSIRQRRASALDPIL
jgi:hypothetical protein